MVSDTENNVDANKSQDGGVEKAALHYAKQGLRVFPVPPGTKQSHKSAEHSNGRPWGATTDDIEIRRDFARWPNANVGIATGPDSGFFVIDVDTPEGHDVDGVASLRALEEQHGKLPATRTAESPSGSRHFYFRWPEQGTIENSTSKIAPGIDVRGAGGMVVAPPSVKPGVGEYVWLNKDQISDAPGWLLELVKADDAPRERGEPQADIAHVELALSVIPNESVGWEEWNKIGMATWAATGGSEQGFAAFDQWSRKSSKYNSGRTREKWNKFSNSPPTDIGAGTLFYLAQQAQPGWEDDMSFYQQRRAEQIARNIEIGEGMSEGSLLPTILTLDEMNKRLVWVGEIGAVADLETLRVRKKDLAFSEYAASIHKEQIEGEAKAKRSNGRVPRLKLWLASKSRISVDILTWWPGLPAICQPPETASGVKKALNLWRGLVPLTVEPPEDWAERITPFIEHVEFLVPVKAERERFLQWLAHIVQRPEVLPHTSYLMITEKTGVGRNLLASIITRALSGHVAAGVSLPRLLDDDFNGRLSRKLLAIVDEAREGSSERKYQRGQRLKSLITEEHREINPKYGVREVQKNCCRWLMFSNHLDAIPFDNTDRRVIVIDNPSERKPESYYEKLYGLLDDAIFIASVRKYLEEVDIASFKPGEHAPMNAAKERVLEEMMSDVERAVRDFMEDCKTELTTRDAINSYVEEQISGGSHFNSRNKVNSAHLTHAIRDAGMIITSKKIKPSGKQQRVVIVRPGTWTVETVKVASGEMLLKGMGTNAKDDDDIPF